MDVKNDFLRPELLYLLLFEQCPVVIKPFVLSGKLDSLLSVLDVFYRIDKFDAENAELFFDEENLDILLENYATAQFVGDSLNEKKPLLFFPQVAQEMHESLQKHSDVVFLGIQSKTGGEQFAEGYEKVAVYDKKRKKIVAQTPKTILSDAIKQKSIIYDWCASVAEILKASPNGGHEVFEYLVGVRAAAQEVFEIFAGGFDEMAYYTASKHQTKQERAVTATISESLFNIDVSASGDLEAVFSKVEKNLQAQRNKTSPNKTQQMEPVQRDPEAWLFRNEEQLSTEFFEISQISNDFFIALQSIMSQIHISRKITNPSKRYVFLRNTIWDRGIPLKSFVKMLNLFLVECQKSNNGRDAKEQKAINRAKVRNVFEKTKDYLPETIEYEELWKKVEGISITLARTSQENPNSPPKTFDFEQTFKKNVKTISAKMNLTGNGAIRQIRKEKISLFHVLQKKYSSLT